MQQYVSDQAETILIYLFVGMFVVLLLDQVVASLTRRRYEGNPVLIVVLALLVAFLVMMDLVIIPTLDR